MTDTADLRAAAQAATPGEWTWGRFDPELLMDEVDVEYLRLASPDRILALLSELERLRDALQSLVDRSPIDVDGETQDEWCHYCDSMRVPEGHDDGCEWKQARAALEGKP